MGSFDRQPEDWNRYADCAWMPAHVIFCNSKWSHTPDRHEHRSVDEVRACFEAALAEAAGTDVWPCGWLMEARYSDGSRYSLPCEAPTRFTDDRGSFECAAGHSHVPAQVRWEQGWDYAEDAEEAAYLRGRVGIDAVAMDGTGI
jgi:hypothetical protein